MGFERHAAPAPAQVATAALADNVDGWTRDRRRADAARAGIRRSLEAAGPACIAFAARNRAEAAIAVSAVPVSQIAEAVAATPEAVAPQPVAAAIASAEAGPAEIAGTVAAPHRPNPGPTGPMLARADLRGMAEAARAAGMTG